MNEPVKKLAAIYVSSGACDPMVLAPTMERCVTAAATEGYSLVAIQYDLACANGASMSRPGHAQTMGRAHAGQIQALIVDTLDQLSTCPAEVAAQVFVLSRRGVEVFVVAADRVVDPEALGRQLHDGLYDGVPMVVGTGELRQERRHDD